VGGTLVPVNLPPVALVFVVAVVAVSERNRVSWQCQSRYPDGPWEVGGRSRWIADGLKTKKKKKCGSSVVAEDFERLILQQSCSKTCKIVRFRSKEGQRRTEKEKEEKDNENQVGLTSVKSLKELKEQTHCESQQTNKLTNLSQEACSFRIFEDLRQL
jgi:hypothetical protein